MRSFLPAIKAMGMCRYVFKRGPHKGDACGRTCTGVRCPAHSEKSLETRRESARKRAGITGEPRKRVPPPEKYRFKKKSEEESEAAAEHSGDSSSSTTSSSEEKAGSGSEGEEAALALKLKKLRMTKAATKRKTSQKK